jgi:hypothetical protein
MAWSKLQCHQYGTKKMGQGRMWTAGPYKAHAPHLPPTLASPPISPWGRGRPLNGLPFGRGPLRWVAPFIIK